MKKLLLIIVLLSIIIGVCGCKNSPSDSTYIYLPKTELHEHQNSGGFHMEYKYTYKYDSYGNVVKKQEYSKRPKSLFYVRDVLFVATYTYDENDRILKEITREEHFSTGFTDDYEITDGGYKYFYDENGLLYKKEEIIPDNVAWTMYWGYRYEYDEFGNLTKEIGCLTDGGEETCVEYFYNPKNELIKKIEDGYTREYDYIYDSDGKLIQMTVAYTDCKNNPDGTEKYTYYYDKYNRLIKQEEIRMNNNGEMMYENVREYKNFVKIKVSKK